MLPISVCLIAKNEEKYIGECLHRLSCFDWEIVVVDTGSTDSTVEIALNYTPNVYHFDWINDFSAARNYSISLAKNECILVVDCDEFLETDKITTEILSKLPDQLHNYQIGMIDLFHHSQDSSIVHDNAARFFHKEYVHYEGAVHEQLVPKQEASLDFVPLPLTFQHMGYSSMALKKEKAARNIILLDQALQQDSQNPYLLFQLGQSYFGIEDYEHALPYFERALTVDVNEQEDYVQTLIESYGYCLLYLQQYSRALELEGIYSVFSVHADFVFLMGLIYMNNALFEQAIAEFLKATTLVSCSVEGVNSYKAFYNIGIIYECIGNPMQAIQYYKKCDGYSPALDGITRCEKGGQFQ